MAAPVWVLAVNLETKTASFTSGLGEAAKSARGSFSDIKASARGMQDGVSEAARGTNYSMMEARHGVMMLGEEFGVHLPRGITTFISSIGPVGAAMEAAFPFLAIVLGATLLIEHLSKVDEAAKKAAESQTKAFDSASKSLEEATAKGLELKIKLADLEGGPTTALEARLRSVRDILASMKLAPELKQQFEELTKGIQVPTLWNPMNWFGSGREAVKGVKDEAQSAALAIGNAVSLTEKQAQADRELWVAQRALAAMQKTGNMQAIEDQQALIRLLQLTKQNIDQQVTNKGTQDKVDADEKAAKAAREQEKIYKEQQAGLDRRFKIEAEYAKKVEETHKKAVEAAEHLAAEQLAADNAVGQELKNAAEQRARLNEQLGREDAEHTRKVAFDRIAAEEEAAMASLGFRRASAQAVAGVEIDAENKRFAAQQAAYAKELSALDKYGKEYALRKKQIENRDAEAEAAHDKQIEKIKAQASQHGFAALTADQQRMTQEFARGFSEVLMRHQSFASMMSSIGSQVVSGMMQNAIQSALSMNFGREKAAAKAARLAFAWGWEHGGPAAPVLAPALGAAAFAAEMAYAKGGIVPGQGNFDSVPAMLTPGEAVLPKSLTEGLTRAANSGDMGGGKGDVHVHHHATYHVQAFDSQGVDRVLQQHGEKFTKHLTSELRRRNL